MNNESSKNVTSVDSVNANLNIGLSKSIPALEPFEVMYMSGGEEPIVVPLVPPPNPKMLDGIEKKRQIRSLIVVVVSCCTHAFATAIVFFRRQFEIFQRKC